MLVGSTDWTGTPDALMRVSIRFLRFDSATIQSYRSDFLHPDLGLPFLPTLGVRRQKSCTFICDGIAAVSRPSSLSSPFLPPGTPIF